MISLSFFPWSWNATRGSRYSALARKREWAGILQNTRKKTRQNNNNLSSKLSKDSFAPYIHFLRFWKSVVFAYTRIDRTLADFWLQRKEATSFCQQRGYYFFFRVRSRWPIFLSEFGPVLLLFIFSLYANFDQRVVEISLVFSFSIPSLREHRVDRSRYSIRLFLFFIFSYRSNRSFRDKYKYRFCRTKTTRLGFVPFFD